MLGAIQRHLDVARRIHWHHHLIRGCIAAHFTNGVISLPHVWSLDGAVQFVCISFVVTEYVVTSREMARKERECTA